MAEYSKFSGKTVEDALLEASIQLGTTSDNVEYHVIEHETKGFLGIGAKKAVIEARLKKPEANIIDEVFRDKGTDKKKKGKKDPEEKGSDKKASDKKASDKKSSDKKDPVSKKDSDKKASGKKTEDQKETKVAKDVRKEEKKQEKQEKKLEKKQENKQQEKEKKEQIKTAGAEIPAEETNRAGAEVAAYGKENMPAGNEKEEEEIMTAYPEQEPEEKLEREKTPRVPADPEVVKERAVTFLEGMLKAMDLPVDIETSFEDDTLYVELKGDDMGVLIGKRGQTLDSVQYLTSLVVNKGKAAYVRVKVDTENYRARRKATLENLAKNIAFKVKKTRRPVYLEPMNPYERRIIHSALQSDPYITTHSEGEEPLRKVVVTLKKRETGNYEDEE